MVPRDVIRDERLQENARTVGAHLKAGLEGLAEGEEAEASPAEPAQA